MSNTVSEGTKVTLSNKVTVPKLLIPKNWNQLTTNSSK